MSRKKEVKFIHCLFPVIVIIALMLYGIGIRQYVFKQSSLPLEALIVACIIIATIELLYLGFSWKEIEASIVAKFSKTIPATIVMISIGLLIGSWMVSGVIPMMIYYGIKIVNVQFIYLTAFLISCVFSIFTGTSWGSMATIGVVLISIGGAVNANMAILAATVISGATFGDKMSPLSDTTNLAAVLAEVSVYDHVRSMMNSTVPAAIIACVVYGICGFAFPTAGISAGDGTIQNTLAVLDGLFHFNILLLLPVVIVVVGSVKKISAAIVMVVSALSATVLGLIFQDYPVTSVLKALSSGYNVSMATWMKDSGLTADSLSVLNRGGVYQFSNMVILCFLIFTFVGCLDLINAMPTIVNRLLAFAKTRFSIVSMTLLSGVSLTALIGHGYASMMLTADIFKYKFDEQNVSRKVLSRSLEDSVTFMSSLIPWNITAVYMASITGVATTRYLPWMVLNLVNLAIALILAYTGIGCYINKTDREPANSK